MFRKIFRKSDDFLIYNRKDLNKLSELIYSQCAKIEGSNWVRIVSWKYSNNPLSTKGSQLEPNGGRFNFGNMIEGFKPFGGLYIAEDYDTAHKEKHGTFSRDIDLRGLTEDDLTQAKGTATVNLPIDFTIFKALDLREPKPLEKLMEIIKEIRLPEKIEIILEKLNLTFKKVINNATDYHQLIFDENWRLFPTAANMPSWSQVFGKLAHASGIEAIVYASVRDRKNCIAIFPDNFKNSDSIVQVDKSLAPSNIQSAELLLDKESYKKFL